MEIGKCAPRAFRIAAEQQIAGVLESALGFVNGRNKLLEPLIIGKARALFRCQRRGIYRVELCQAGAAASADDRDVGQPAIDEPVAGFAPKPRCVSDP